MSDLSDLQIDPASVPEHYGQRPPPLPDGTYVVSVSETEERATRKPPVERMLVLVLRVEDGEYAGRKIYHNMMLWHSKPVVAEIARTHLSALTGACGFARVSRSEELLGIPVACKIRVSRDQNGDLTQNEVVAYGRLPEAPPAQRAPPPIAPPPPAAPAPRGAVRPNAPTRAAEIAAGTPF